MIETKILTLTYDLPTLELAQKIYNVVKEKIKNSKIISTELIYSDYLIFVDGTYFKNEHIPYNQYVQKGSVRISINPEDKDCGLLFLKDIASEVLPEFMKPYGIVIIENEQKIITQNLQ